MPNGKPTLLERTISYLAPEWGLRRQRARVAGELLERHYDAASVGRRTQGWRRSISDANAATGPSLARLRDAARDLVRNNGFAESALTTITDHVVGKGITAKPAKPNKRASDIWAAWAETTDCDSDGRNDFAGLEALVMRCVVESGECLVRRRLRREEDGLAIPLQLQVLEPDYLDTLKTGITVTSANGLTTGRIIHGVEYDLLGKRAAYWIFKDHPGMELGGSAESFRVPAESVLHVYRQGRPGQVRGPSWFAPVLLKFRDFDELDDATLMKAKVAACLAVLTSDIDGTAPALGVSTPENPTIDSLEPGMILNVPPGRTISVVEPPTTRDYPDFAELTLRAIATGIGVAYEDLTGDYGQMPFSAARMSRLRHWGRVTNWRWRILIPQFCAPSWAWAMQVAGIMGLDDAPLVARWTAPPPPMIDPQNEGLAYSRNIRSGITTLFEALRERGYEPLEVLAEMKLANETLDKLGLVLDSDARKTTQQGMMQMLAEPATPDEVYGDPTPAPDEAAPADDEEPAPDDEEDDGQEAAKGNGKAPAGKAARA